MQKDLLYCAIDVSKDKLDIDAAALALPAQLGNDHAGFRQLISASRHNPVLKDFYERLRKAGKLKKVALTAVMRKLLICLNALLRKLANQHASEEGLCTSPGKTDTYSRFSLVYC